MECELRRSASAERSRGACFTNLCARGERERGIHTHLRTGIESIRPHTSAYVRTRPHTSAQRDRDTDTRANRNRERDTYTLSLSRERERGIQTHVRTGMPDAAAAPIHTQTHVRTGIRVYVSLSLSLSNTCVCIPLSLSQAHVRTGICNRCSCCVRHVAYIARVMRVAYIDASRHKA
jgi:hypothetical protein